jgi:hypothetical protein
MCRVSVAVLLAVSAAGCSSNPYRHFNGEYGYSDSPISADQYEVSYVGESDVSPTQARDYATLRAAEVAIQHNKAYFEILKSDWSQRTDTVAVPGDTYVNTTGTKGSRFTTVTQTPGYIRNYASPTSVMTIRLLDQKTGSSLDANQVLAEASQKGIKLTRGFSSPPQQ